MEWNGQVHFTRVDESDDLLIIEKKPLTRNEVHSRNTKDFYSIIFPVGFYSE